MKAAKLIILSVLIFPCFEAASVRSVEPVDSVGEFDDVRWKDLNLI